MRENTVRRAQREDLPDILKIYAKARDYMKETGNPDQWGDDHPAREMLERDIDVGDLYVVENGGEIVGVFALVFGDDPTYESIEGAWVSQEPYGAIHRVAGLPGHGSFKTALAYAKERSDHLRIDTHPDNKIMQHLIRESGFSERGMIYLQLLQHEDPRIAYEWVESHDGSTPI